LNLESLLVTLYSDAKNGYSTNISTICQSFNILILRLESNYVTYAIIPTLRLKIT